MDLLFLSGRENTEWRDLEDGRSESQCQTELGTEPLEKKGKQVGGSGEPLRMSTYEITFQLGQFSKISRPRMVNLQLFRCCWSPNFHQLQLPWPIVWDGVSCSPQTAPNLGAVCGLQVCRKPRRLGQNVHLRPAVHFLTAPHVRVISPISWGKKYVWTKAMFDARMLTFSTLSLTYFANVLYKFLAEDVPDSRK